MSLGQAGFEKGKLLVLRDEGASIVKSKALVEYASVKVKSVDKLLKELESDSFDLIILASLKRKNSLVSAYSKIRKQSELPILVVKDIEQRLDYPRNSFGLDFISNPLNESDLIFKLESLTHSNTADRERAESLISHANDALFLVDVKTKMIEQVNQKSCENLGYTEKELLGMPISKVTSVNDILDLSGKRIDFAELQNRVKRDGNAIVRSVHTKKDGSKLQVGVSISLVKNGKDLKMLALARIIEGAKNVEDNLRLKLGLFENLTERMDMFFSYIGKDGTYKYVNDYYEKVFQRPKEKILGLTPLELSGEDTFNQVKGYLDRALKGENVFYEMELQQHSSGITWVKGWTIPDVDDDGKVKGVFAMVQDISAQKRGEIDIDKAEEKFKKYIENSADVITVVNDQNEMVYNSPNNHQLFGYDANSRVGTGLFKSVHPDDVKNLEIISNIMKKNPNQPFVSRYRFKHKEGNWKWIESSGRYIDTVEEEENPYFIYNSRDISEKKAAEDLLKKVFTITSTRTGTEYFKEVTRFMQVSLDVDYALIAIFEENHSAVRSIAFCDRLGYLPEARYPVKNTPCAHVYDQGFKIIRDNVQKEFPKFSYLKETKIRGYAGAVLNNDLGEPIGLIAIHSIKPLDNNKQIEELLRIVVPRTESELTRKLTEDVLEDSRKRNLAVLSAIPDMMFITNADGDYIDYYSNTKFDKDQEPKGKNMRDILPPEIWKKEIAMGKQVLKSGTPQIWEYEYKGRFFESRLVKADEGKLMKIVRDVTLRIKTERLLKEKQTALERAQEIANVGDWELDLKTGKGLWSAQHYKIFGYLPGEVEVTQMLFESHIVPEDLKRYIKTTRKELEASGAFKYEYRIKTKQGKLKHLLSLGEAVKDGKGKMIKLFGTVQDITDRKLAELTLISSEEKFRQLTESASDAIIITNNDLEIEFWNNGAELIFGHLKDDIQGRKFTGLIPHRYRGVYRELITKIDSGDSREVSNKTIEIEGVHKTGVEFDIEISVAGWEADNVKYYCSIVRDITSRKKAERELIESKEKYQSLFEKMDEGLLLSDKSGKIELVNPQLELITGYSREELLGNNGYDLLHPKTERQRLKDNLIDRKNGKSGRYETKMITKDGREIWVHVSSSPQFDVNGDFNGVMSMIVDITKSRKSSLQQHAIYNIARAAHKQVLDVDYLSELVHNEVKAILNIDSFYLAIFDEDKKEISFPYAFDSRKRVKNPKKAYPIIKFKSAASPLERIKNPAKLVKQREELLNARLEKSVKAKTTMAFPLTGDGRVIGMIGVKSYSKSNAFDNEDRNFFKYVAVQASNILEREWAMQNILRREERYRNLFERNMSGVYRLTMDGKFIECNRAFAKIIGAKDVLSVKGKYINELYTTSEDRDFIQLLIDAGGVLTGLETELELPDGREIWILENTNVIKDIKGNTLYIEGTIIDVTERKQAELKILEERKQAVQYQSMLLSSQINPHFIFNSLNSVQFYILDQNIEPALNYISEFSMLMRTVLQNSLHKSIPIADEIEFLKLYLNLEQKRFSGRFEYYIDVDDDIDPTEMQIPPMLLQPYVENTVVHGIGNKEGEGHIWINFSEDKGLIKCSIKDDGVGRKKAMELKILKTGGAPQHKSLGMGITSTRLDLLNELSEGAYSVYIEDLESRNGVPMGTQIDVYFPCTESDDWD